MSQRFLRWLGFFCVLASSILHADWSDPTNLTNSGLNANDAQIAMDSAGNARAIWSRSDGTNMIIQTRYKPLGGVWGAVLPLSDPEQNASAPQIVMDTAGNAMAVWARNGSIQAKRYDVLTATWEGIGILSESGCNSPQVAMDNSGNAIAVWSKYNDPNTIIQAKRYDPVNKTWIDPIDLSNTEQNAGSPQIVIDSSGNATALWRQSLNGKYVIQSKSRDFTSGDWDTDPTNLSDETLNGSSPDIAIDGQGNITAVWAEEQSLNNQNIQCRYKPAASSWDSSVTDLCVAENLKPTTVPQIAVDSAGNTTVVWRKYTGSSYIIQSKYRPAGGDWQIITTPLTSTGNASYPQISVASNSGDATAVWFLYNGSHNIIQAASKPFGGHWASSATTLSDVEEESSYPKLAVDSLGNAVAVWQTKWNDSNTLIQSASMLLPCTVTQVNPNVGPLAGGTTVTITGTNFYNVTAVYFGANPATSFTRISETTLLAVAPSSTSSSTVHITVTASSQTSEATNLDLYTYLPDAPSKCRGKVHSRTEKHQFSLYTKWRSSLSSSVEQYNIYSGDQLISSINSTQPNSAHIHFWAKYKKVHEMPDWFLRKLLRRYTIRAVDSNQQTSDARHISVKK